VKKSKYYKRAVFSADVIKAAFTVFATSVPQESKDKYESSYFSVQTADGGWRHDSEEEFFSDYRKGAGAATYDWTFGAISNSFSFEVRVQGRGNERGTRVEIAAPDRPRIEKGFEVFEEHLADSVSPEPEVETPKPTVFIGHGGSSQWRDLKDHLQDQHGYEVMAYEVGARAGHTIRDILDDMLGRSSFAVLVMSAEDEDTEGKFHARPNVIHELGLFQGKLGFSRAVVLLEQGTQEFSNIYGIQQIRYGKGNIRETYGEVLATLRREFELN